MCSYLGSFPAPLARAMVRAFSDPGDVVLDPFSGRGTTLLEARLLGRRALASDLNPIAVALSRAKSASVESDEVYERIAEMERRFDPVLYAPNASVQPEPIRLIYNLDTLAQLCYLRRALRRSDADVDRFLVGAVLGIMHGSERKDGTSAYASISMPNTFSMSPGYVRKYVANNRLRRVPRDVFAILRSKVGRLYAKGGADGPRASVRELNVRELLDGYADVAGTVDLVLTSPPYLGVVNYARQNWIRTWFLDVDAEGVSRELDDELTPVDWVQFMNVVVADIKKILSPKGIVALVIGDVAKPGSGTVSLARELIRHVQTTGDFEFIGCISDYLHVEAKTTRIWSKTKGKATSVDRIVILSNAEPNPDWAGAGGALLDGAMASFECSADDMRRHAEEFSTS